jgi:hypothetical protein
MVWSLPEATTGWHQVGKRVVQNLLSAVNQQKAMKKYSAQTGYPTAHALIRKSAGNYRRTPRGRGKEKGKNARNTGAAKTPRHEATRAVAATL